MKILVVDDSPTSRLAIKQALTQALPGTAVHEAASGNEAQAWMMQNNASLVITDLEMEQGDGIEFIQWLRSLPIHSDTQVVVHSNHVDMLVKAVLNRYKPISFLPKPVSPAELALRVPGLAQAA